MLIATLWVFRHFYQTLPEYPIPDEQVGILKLPKREAWVTRDRSFGREDFKDDLSLEDLEHISREHFKITSSRDGFFIEDLGSKGGTVVDGAEIKGKGLQKLRKGVEISLPKGLRIRFATKADVGKSMEMKTMEVKSDTITAASVRAALAKLVLQDDREIEIREKEREFGREDFKSILPEEKLGFVSGKHFRITRSESESYIEDLESTNGTMLNGEEIKAQRKMKLKDGDGILVGSVLKIRYVEHATG